MFLLPHMALKNICWYQYFFHVLTWLSQHNDACKTSKKR
jgi:hypothetical protein